VPPGRSGRSSDQAKSLPLSEIGNIKIDLRETWIYRWNLIRLAQDRIQWRAFVNTVMNLRVP
jgi:hypothetical protein